MRIILTLTFLFISLIAHSQATQGTRLTAPIVPNDSSDVYPTHDETFGKGGYRSVSTIAQRDAIKPALRKEGMLVKVIQDNKTYTLKGGIENANWQIFLNIDSINNLKVTQKLSVQALPGAYSTTFPLEVKDSAGYTRGAISSKGMIVTGRQHNPTVNVDALVLLGAKNQVSGVDGIAVGTNAKAISDSSMVVGKNITNNRAGSVQVGYKNNSINFDNDSARVTGNWPFLKGFPYKKTFTDYVYWLLDGNSFWVVDDENYDHGLSVMHNKYTGTVQSYLSGYDPYNLIEGKVTANGGAHLQSGDQVLTVWDKKGAYYWHRYTVQNDLWIPDKYYTDSLKAVLQSLINTKQNSLGTGNTSQYLRGDLTWQTIPASATWGGITGTLSAQTDLQNALNAKENTISNGLAGQYFGFNKTWLSFPAFMYQESAQGLQDTSITHSKIFYGRQSATGAGFEDYITFSPRTANQSFQLQYGHVYNEFWIRGWKPGTSSWQPWRKLVFASDMDTANTRITNYINTQVSIVDAKTATVGYTFTEQRADVTTGVFNLHKFGNVVNFNFGFYRTAADADDTFVYLGQIPVGARPTQYTYGTINPGNGTEVGQIRIDTDGIVEINCGNSNQSWYGNLTWILFNP